MRLVRYGRPGKEKPGLFDEEGRLRDLSGVVADIDGALLSTARCASWPRSTGRRCRWCAAIRAWACR
jgi:hypothetical protein